MLLFRLTNVFLKSLFDDAVLNIPNLGYNPTGFSLGKQNVEGNMGYSKISALPRALFHCMTNLTDGKFVTTGIKFDVAKATIKPRKYGNH